MTLSCSQQINPDIQRGSDYVYCPGYPQVRFSAVGFLNENNEASIQLAADIVYGSLIYKMREGEQQDNVAIDVRIVSTDEEESFTEAEYYEIDIARDDAVIVNSEKSYIFEEDIMIPPGRYRVYFTVTDLNSDQRITREAQTFMPDPQP